MNKRCLEQVDVWLGSKSPANLLQSQVFNLQKDLNTAKCRLWTLQSASVYLAVSNLASPGTVRIRFQQYRRRYLSIHYCIETRSVGVIGLDLTSSRFSLHTRSRKEHDDAMECRMKNRVT